MPVGAAIGIGGAVGGIAQGAGGLLGAQGQQKAANKAGAGQILGAQQAAGAIGSAVGSANAGLGAYGNKLWDIYGGATGKLDPFIGYGTTAGNMLTSQLPTLTQPFQDMFSTPESMNAWLEQTPGYQFTLDQGLKAAQNSYAAKGLGSSGAAEKGAIDYATGLAGTTFQQQFQNYLGQNAQAYNMLYGLTGLGENAAAQYGTLSGQFAGLGTDIEKMISQNLLTGGMGQANAYVNAANARANALIGGANAMAGGYGQVAQGIGQGANALVGGYIYNDLYGNPTNGGAPTSGWEPSVQSAPAGNPLSGVQSPLITEPQPSPYWSWGGYM